MPKDQDEAFREAVERSLARLGQPDRAKAQAEMARVQGNVGLDSRRLAAQAPNAPSDAYEFRMGMHASMRLTPWPPPPPPDPREDVAALRKRLEAETVRANKLADICGGLQKRAEDAERARDKAEAALARRGRR